MSTSEPAIADGLRFPLPDVSLIPATLYSFRIGADGNASFPFVSPGCADVYGFTPDEAMADARLMHEAIHPGDRKRFNADGQRSLNTLQPLRWEGRIVRRDGRTRPVIVTSAPSRHADGATEWHGVVIERPSRPLRATRPGAPQLVAELAEAHEHGRTSLSDAAGPAGPLAGIALCAQWALKELDRASLDPVKDVNDDVVRRCLEAILRQLISATPAS